MLIKYGATTVKYHLRSDGRYALSWKEAGKAQRTTSKGSEEEVKTKCRQIAKRVEKSSGVTAISYSDYEILTAFKDLCASINKPPYQLIEEIKGEASVGAVEVILFTDFLQKTDDEYAKDRFKSPETWNTLDDEFKAFNSKYKDILLTDIDLNLLNQWCDRNEPSEQTFNNRVTMWRTLYNKSKQRGDYQIAKSPADRINKKIIPTKIPAVFSVKELDAIMQFLIKEGNPGTLAAFGIAVWSGMRPTEIQRLHWHNLDIPNEYIHADHTICRKLRHERYIPILPALKKLLIHVNSEAQSGQIITNNQWRVLSRKLREKGIIKKWPEDVTRHSYISYRIADKGNIGAIANECGNSEEIIKKRYRKPIKPSEGKAWFKPIKFK